MDLIQKKEVMMKRKSHLGNCPPFVDWLSLFSLDLYTTTKQLKTITTLPSFDSFIHSFLIIIVIMIITFFYMREVLLIIIISWFLCHELFHFIFIVASDTNITTEIRWWWWLRFWDKDCHLEPTTLRLKQTVGDDDSPLNIIMIEMSGVGFNQVLLLIRPDLIGTDYDDGYNYDDDDGDKIVLKSSKESKDKLDRGTDPHKN